MRVKLTKLTELPDALNPNNIDEGYTEIHNCPDAYFRPPTVDERFAPSSWWSTSGVQEIINENTFRTYSSIYEWEILKEDE